MAIATGTRLGPYEVVGSLGAGGMGEVYRARDARLSREVAVKVLPAEVASDPSRLKRFEKEARSASALNHPNIVTVYDLGTTDGVSWIAMERVEGKTLRELLFAGALPIKRLLAIAAQIGEGLSKAHEAGIVHRDLKPENVMVTKDGIVKILDFGLAKLTGPVSGSDEGSHLPTETGTSPGMLVGTAGYMSPEQASGQPVDFRSDQFAFGTMLYEMATGKRAFQKKTGVDTLAAVLNEEPERIETVSPQTPAPLCWIVERCLAKDPEGRFASTKDLARDLATLRDHLTESIGVRAIESARRPRRFLGALAAVAVLAAAVFVGRTLWKEPRPLTPTFQPLTFRRGSVWSARFSPDGNTIVYTAAWNGEPEQLYSTRPESRESGVLPFPGATVAAISSSGEMALLKDGVLSRAPLAGGAAREVLEDVLDADWSPDGTQLLVLRQVSGRQRLEYPIGKVLYEAQPPGGIGSPRVSPRGDRIAFVDLLFSWGDTPGSIAVVDLQGRKTTLSKGWGAMSAPTWSPEGDEVWFTGGLRQDAKRGELRAVSLEARERVVLQAPVDFALADVSRDGRGLLVSGGCRASIAGVVPGESAERDLSWHDHSSVQDLSADGRTMVFMEGLEEGGKSGEGNAVYIRKLDGSAAIRIGDGRPFRLSPDGRWVIAHIANPPTLTLVATGPGEPRTLERGSIEQYMWGAAWFPDGKRILFNGREPGRDTRAYVQNIDGGEPRLLLPEGVSGRLVSPDGKLIAAVDRADRKIVFFSEEGQPIELPHDLPPGSEPAVFSSDSRFLFTFVWGQQMPTPVYRLDLATGKKQLWKELAPADSTGLEGNSIIRLSADGRSYAYGYGRCLNDLYLVEGLK